MIGTGAMPLAHSRTPMAVTLRKMMEKPEVRAEVKLEPKAAAIESSAGRHRRLTDGKQRCSMRRSHASTAAALKAAYSTKAVWLKAAGSWATERASAESSSV